MKDEYKDMIVMQGMLNTTQQAVKEKNEEIARSVSTIACMSAWLQTNLGSVCNN